MSTSLVQGILVLNLMNSRDMILGWDAMALPIFMTAWFAVQKLFIEGFCFYLVTFTYSQYTADSAYLIDYCELTAFE